MTQEPITPIGTEFHSDFFATFDIQGDEPMGEDSPPAIPGRSGKDRFGQFE